MNFFAQKNCLTNKLCDKKERNLLNGSFVWRAKIFTNGPIFCWKMAFFFLKCSMIEISLIDLFVSKKWTYRFFLIKIPQALEIF